VISVGNLTVGGNGKTPFTILLASALKEEGLKVAVSHRGYKGAYENMTKLISDEDHLFEDARNAGDEPLLIAQNLKGIPVIVGKNRKKAIEFLEENVRPDVVILDDSFQHLKVRHDYDFLLFNGENPIGNGFLTPAGMLREPKSAMKYADCFVLNDISGEVSIPKIFKKYSTPLFTTSYHIAHFIHYSDLGKSESSPFVRKKIYLLSGIGNPSSFERSITELGLSFVHHYQFADHHKFSENDIASILRRAKNQNIDAIITTEKDFVKLQKLDIAKELIYYAKLHVKINEMDTFNGIVRTIKKEIGT